jgi:hypothetical protein
MDFITSLGFGCSFPAFVVVVEGEGRGGVFEESGVGVGAIVSSSSSSTSVISLLALSFFNNAINVYLLLFFGMKNRICERRGNKKKFALVFV